MQSVGIYLWCHNMLVSKILLTFSSINIAIITMVSESWNPNIEYSSTVQIQSTLCSYQFVILYLPGLLFRISVFIKKMFQLVVIFVLLLNYILYLYFCNLGIFCMFSTIFIYKTPRYDEICCWQILPESVSFWG